MVATPERLNIEQNSKTVMEENSILAKDFFPNQNTMQEGSFPCQTWQVPDSIAD
jgi:hypothetical protein